ncbi:Scarecrow-like protein 8 [Musa troglodytarum]|uniref:Scarecrow-like protein 8 n=1 Tax=Musa troglodytarum TaxID=320322 RepID=A0A9E7JVR3_9LILI|nr:Scarecrow-like protein 8 [Musa troglodytarum]
MQLQHALFLRSVKQRTLLNSPASHNFSPPLPPADLSSGSSSSLISAKLTQNGLARSREQSSTPQVAASGAESRPSAAVRDRLQELERRLLLDEEEGEGDVSTSGSAVTTAEWSEAMQQLITPPTPVSSSASCSPSSSSAAVAASSSRQMLLETAAAIADGNLETATANLVVLKRVANPRGDAEQRLTAVMVDALISRLKLPQAGSSSLPIAALCSAEHFAATQMLYELSPCFKLGLITANLAILEATKEQPMIHILDFDVGQGGQYAVLLHALAERHRLRPITAVSDPTSPFTNNNSGGNLRAVGNRLEKLAERAGLAVRFNVVHLRAAELDASALTCEPGEALVVNLAFALSRVPDESVSPTNPRDEILRRVRALRPRVVALVEQEINTSTAAFAARFGEACAHYGALLESLDATVARDSVQRARVEAGLARRALNSVANEGADRVERCEVFGKWRARMGMAGFDPVPLGPAVIEPVKARFASIRSNQGFTIREEAGGHGLGFGWKGRVLAVASSWR